MVNKIYTNDISLPDLADQFATFGLKAKVVAELVQALSVFDSSTQEGELQPDQILDHNEWAVALSQSEVQALLKKHNIAAFEAAPELSVESAQENLSQKLYQTLSLIVPWVENLKLRWESGEDVGDDVRQTLVIAIQNLEVSLSSGEYEYAQDILAVIIELAPIINMPVTEFEGLQYALLGIWTKAEELLDESYDTFLAELRAAQQQYEIQQQVSEEVYVFKVMTSIAQENLYRQFGEAPDQHVKSVMERMSLVQKLATEFLLAGKASNMDEALDLVVQSQKIRNPLGRALDKNAILQMYDFAKVPVERMAKISKLSGDEFQNAILEFVNEARDGVVSYYGAPTGVLQQILQDASQSTNPAIAERAKEMLAGMTGESSWTGLDDDEFHTIMVDGALQTVVTILPAAFVSGMLGRTAHGLVRGSLYGGETVVMRGTQLSGRALAATAGFATEATSFWLVSESISQMAFGHSDFSGASFLKTGLFLGGLKGIGVVCGRLNKSLETLFNGVENSILKNNLQRFSFWNEQFLQVVWGAGLGLAGEEWGLQQKRDLSLKARMVEAGIQQLMMLAGGVGSQKLMDSSAQNFPNTAFGKLARLEQQTRVSATGFKFTREDMIQAIAKGQSDFSWCDLSGMDLSGLDLRGVKLNPYFLIEFDFSKSKISGLDFTHCTSRVSINRLPDDLTNCKFTALQLQRLWNEGRRDFRGVDFTGLGSGVDVLNLSNCDLRGVIFPRLHVYNSIEDIKLIIDAAQLTQAEFDWLASNDRFVDFKNMNLQNCDMSSLFSLSKTLLRSQYDLSGSLLPMDFVNLLRAHPNHHILLTIDSRQFLVLFELGLKDFRCLNLTDVDLSFTDMNGIFLNPEGLPKNPTHRPFLSGAIITSDPRQYYDLGYRDFSGAIFVSRYFYGDFSQCDFSHAQFVCCEFVHSANFAGSDFYSSKWIFDGIEQKLFSNQIPFTEMATIVRNFRIESNLNLTFKQTIFQNCDLSALRSIDIGTENVFENCILSKEAIHDLMTGESYQLHYYNSNFAETISEIMRVKKEYAEQRLVNEDLPSDMSHVELGPDAIESYLQLIKLRNSPSVFYGVTLTGDLTHLDWPPNTQFENCIFVGAILPETLRSATEKSRTNTVIIETAQHELPEYVKNYFLFENCGYRSNSDQISLTILELEALLTNDHYPIEVLLDGKWAGYHYVRDIRIVVNNAEELKRVEQFVNEGRIINCKIDKRFVAEDR